MIATALLLSLLPCAQIEDLGDTLHRATDKTSYEQGAYAAAKKLAEIRTAEAMELRLELFDDKLDTYRGVYLRDWFFSGFLKATEQEEADLMAKAAVDRKRSEWQRVLLLRGLGRCRATVSAKLMLNKAFDKAPPVVQREWSATLGVLLVEKRLDFSQVKLGSWVSGEALVRNRILSSGALFGLAFVGNLSSTEIEMLTRAAQKAKSPGDRAEYLRALANDTNGWPAFGNAASWVFAAKESAPKAVYIDAAVNNKVVFAVPALIHALEIESSRDPSRFRGDLGAALRQLTGQGFGDDPKIWKRWYAEAGAEWLAASRAEETTVKTAKRFERDTVARFFGLAIDSANVAFLIDGSGSMSMSKLGELSCADAAAKEVEGFLSTLPKGVMFQVVVMEAEAEFAFKKMVPATKSNRTKALKFIHSRPFRSTSALYDALEQVAADPLVDTIVVISDGGSSAGKHQYSGHILDAAERLYARTGIRIYTVLVTDSTKHEKFMRNLAAITGGRMTAPTD